MKGKGEASSRIFESNSVELLGRDLIALEFAFNSDICSLLARRAFTRFVRLEQVSCSYSAVSRKHLGVAISPRRSLELFADADAAHAQLQRCQFHLYCSIPSTSIPANFILTATSRR